MKEILEQMELTIRLFEIQAKQFIKENKEKENFAEVELLNNRLNYLKIH